MSPLLTLLCARVAIIRQFAAIQDIHQDSNSGNQSEHDGPGNQENFNGSFHDRKIKRGEASASFLADPGNCDNLGGSVLRLVFLSMWSYVGSRMFSAGSNFKTGAARKTLQLRRPIESSLALRTRLSIGHRQSRASAKAVAASITQRNHQLCHHRGRMRKES